MTSQTDPLKVCQYPKHKGIPWEDVVEMDYKYVLWLISGEGPKSIMEVPELYSYLEELCEGHEQDLRENDYDEGPQFGDRY